MSAEEPAIPAPTGGRRARGQPHAVDAKEPHDVGEQAVVAVGGELPPAVGGQAGAGILGHDPQAAIRAGRHRADGALPDGRVHRLRAGVKEVQGPDIEGASGEIDAGRGRSVHLHARIIIAGLLHRLPVRFGGGVRLS